MFTIITQGSFKSAGVPVRIPLPSSVDYFVTHNLTQAAAAAPTAGTKYEWFGNPSFAVNSAVEWFKSGSTVINETVQTTQGFTYVTAQPVPGPLNANAITSITNANPAVVSQTNTYSNGQILQFIGTTGMEVLGGFNAQISSVSGGGYTLLGLPATASNGFAAAATAGNTRPVSPFAAVDPQFLFITNVSQASQAVVSTSVDPSPYYVVGNKIHFSIPKSFGMTQLDQLTGTIVAVNAVSASGNIGAYNLNVDINTTAFTAFAWPASTLSPTTPLFATLSPAGSSTQFNPVTLVQTGYEFQKTPFHSGQFIPYMFLSAGARAPAGQNNDTVVWQAFKMEGTFYGSV